MARVSDLGLVQGSDLSRFEVQGNSLASGGDYIALLKPRVMSLVIFTGFVGMVIAPGHVHPFIGFVALLCIAVGAGASGALNMWYDADIDAVMGRTAKRPIPSGHVSPPEALAFGLVLSVGSVTLMALAVNWLAAGLLAFTIFFYAVIYTMWLKRRTPQNIVIGGAAGALPPVIGWAAVSQDISVQSLSLFAIILIWTPPHFWALALNQVDDYRAAAVPMLPVVAGLDATRRQILIYTILLGLVSLSPLALGFAGVLYGAIAVVLGTCFVVIAYSLMRHGDGPQARAQSMRLFGFSILYLFVLFGSLPLERLAGLAPILPL